MSEYPRISDDPRVQVEYETMRRNGQSHSIAEICATQTMPGISGTDSIFWSGQWEREDATIKEYRKIAERQGYDTTGKRYLSQLARRPADPRAFVSGRGDILRIANEDNLGIDGAVRRTRVTGIDDPGPEKPYEVADDIVDEQVEVMVAKDKSLAKDRKEIKKHLKRKLSGALK